MYLKVDIPEHFQFRIVRSLKDMLLRKETEIHYIGGAEVLPPPLPAKDCLLYTSPSPRDLSTSRMPSSA